MFCSLSNKPQPQLVFDSTPLTYFDTHRHLGVTLSCDGTWHQHIDNVIASAKKVLSSMQALKFKLRRKTLNQIYLSYLRPILEYASVVWDNCTEYEKETLEKL